YGDLKPVPEAPPVTEREQEQTSPRHKRLPISIQVEKLAMAYPIPDISSPVLPTLEVVQGLLTGGKSGRLKRALIDTGLASAVDCGPDDLRDPGVFIVTVN